MTVGDWLLHPCGLPMWQVLANITVGILTGHVLRVIWRWRP